MAGFLASSVVADDGVLVGCRMLRGDLGPYRSRNTEELLRIQPVPGGARTPGIDILRNGTEGLPLGASNLPRVRGTESRVPPNPRTSYEGYRVDTYKYNVITYK